MRTRDITLYLVLVFVLGLGTQFAALYGGLDGPGDTWLKLTMWTPAIAALPAGATARSWVWQSLKRGAFKWWPLAFLLGWAPTLIETVLLWATGSGGWNAGAFPLAPDGGVAEINGLAMVLGVGQQGWAWFALNLLVTLVVASLVFAIIGGLGEELGWRAVLQRALDKRVRPLIAAVAVGLIWAYWHLPVNLSGYNDPGFPLLSALVTFPVAVVGFAVMYAWLWRRSGGAVWPVAIVHGANNTISAGFIVVADGAVAATMASVAATLILGVGFGWLLRRDSSGTPTFSSGENGGG